MEGTTVNMIYGYPAITSLATAAGLSTDDYTVSTTGGGTVPSLSSGEAAIQPKKNPKVGCYIKYTQAVDANTPATVDTSTVTAANCL
jgi:hypothetical protein